MRVRALSVCASCAAMRANNCQSSVRALSLRALCLETKQIAGLSVCVWTAECRCRAMSRARPCARGDDCVLACVHMRRFQATRTRSHTHPYTTNTEHTWALECAVNYRTIMEVNYASICFARPDACERSSVCVCISANVAGHLFLLPPLDHQMGVMFIAKLARCRTEETLQSHLISLDARSLIATVRLCVCAAQTAHRQLRTQNVYIAISRIGHILRRTRFAAIAQ